MFHVIECLVEGVWQQSAAGTGGGVLHYMKLPLCTLRCGIEIINISFLTLKNSPKKS